MSADRIATIQRIAEKVAAAAVLLDEAERIAFTALFPTARLIELQDKVDDEAAVWRAMR